MDIFKLKHCFLLAVYALFGMIPAVAQEEAQAYFTVDEMPDLIQILPPPPDTTGVKFAYDVTRYMWGKAQRLDSERSEMAIGDAEFSLNRIINIFSEPFGQQISYENTPEIFRLLHDFAVTSDNICMKIKNYYIRKRPFMVFNERTLTPELEGSLSLNGSYPSGHTILGWCAALILSEINPDNTEALMARGYMFGENRVIVGAHWQSDVDAGMLAASILYMRLHTNQVFLEQMAKARSEFLVKKGVASTDRSPLYPHVSTNNHIYNLSGYQIPKEPSDGIYIQSGKKKLSHNLHP